MSTPPSDWEVVIGLEVHVQLHTRAKVFASSPWGFGKEPNEQVDPVVLGLPGTLPVVNREAVEKSILFGLVVGASVPEHCSWDRKNYFYPDNPKNYQLTQKDFPVVVGGQVEIELPGASRNVMGEHKFIRIHHAHLEEDVGKLSHAGSGSLVDYNRAGVPLLEIVTEPDLRSSSEAEAFLRSLVAMLTQAGVADCDMEKGQLRCDCNVSVRRRGVEKLGTRTETKNLNSISSVRDTVIYETARQIRELEAGRSITQETRGWNAELARGYVLRDKEDAHDYRYFPDPDIPTLKISRETVSRLAKLVPESLYDRQRRYIDKLGLPYTAASVLVNDRALAEWFEAAVAAHPTNPSGIANLVANDLLRDLAASAGAIDDSGVTPVSLASCPIKPAQLAGLVKLTDEGVISKQQAKEVFAEMFKSGQDAAAIVDAKGLRQNSDTGELEKIVQEVIADPAVAKSIAEYRAGNEKAINALKGPIMKRTQGKANPILIDQLLRKFLA
ncbi:MAG: Asp-tRNA(Asn)/Glu-tRNA(Gln) amidotransferase subunit GatB [Verrucomicrobiota bacterium]